MRKIKIQLHLHDVNALVWAFKTYPIDGQDVASLLSKSVLADFDTWCQARTISWRNDELLRPKNGRKKKHTVSLANHTARALAVYLTGLLSRNLIHNEYTRTCIDMVRLEATQQLA